MIGEALHQLEAAFTSVLEGFNERLAQHEQHKDVENAGAEVHRVDVAVQAIARDVTELRDEVAAVKTLIAERFSEALAAASKAEGAAGALESRINALEVSVSELTKASA